MYKKFNQLYNLKIFTSGRLNEAIFWWVGGQVRLQGFLSTLQCSDL